MLSIFRSRQQTAMVPKPQPQDLVASGRRANVLIAGINHYDESPLLIGRGESLHSMYVGPTGTGKTSSMGFHLEQSIHAGRNAFVVDLKGMDYGLYAAMCAAAERCGIDPPIYLTNRYKKPTYLCPVMKTNWWKYNFGPDEKADALVAALGLDDAQAHSWWSDVAEELYNFIAEEVDPEDIDDFVKFFRLIEERRNDLPKSMRNDVVHGAIKAKRLARVSMFNPPENCHPAALEHALDLQDLFRTDKQRLVFVSLSGVRTPKTASVIARFLGRALLLAADDLEGQRKAMIDVAYDEAQKGLGPGFMDVALTLSRAAGVSFSAGFQDIKSLYHRGIDYCSLFEENTALQYCFAAFGPDAIKRQIALSGEVMEIMKSRTYSYPGLVSWRSWSETFRGQVTTRFNVNDIAQMSADPERFIFRATRDTDLCKLQGLPVMARVLRHISQDEYERRARIEWPEPNERTVICGEHLPHRRPAITNVPVPETGIPVSQEKPVILHPPRR